MSCKIEKTIADIIKVLEEDNYKGKDLGLKEDRVAGKVTGLNKIKDTLDALNRSAALLDNGREASKIESKTAVVTSKKKLENSIKSPSDNNNNNNNNNMTEEVSSLKWLNDNEVITDEKGKSTVKITSLDQLVKVSNEYHDMMAEKAGAPWVDWNKHKDLFTGLIKEVVGKDFKEVSIKFVKDLKNPENKNVLGYATGNTISLSSNEISNAYPLKVVAHELSHIVTLEGLKKYPHLKARVREIMDRTSELARQKNFAYAYKNETEFVAEIMSNPQLQTVLATVKSDGKTTMLDKVKKIFSFLLTRAKADEASALHDALDVIVQLQSNSNETTEIASYGVKERLWNTTNNSRLIGPMKAHIDGLRKSLQVQVVKANKDALRYVFDKVKEDVISVLENEGKELDSKVVAGEYDPHTNIAYIADRSVMTGKSIKDTIKEAVADVLKDEDTYSEENMTKVMEAQKDTIEKIENNIAETLSAIESNDGKVTTILHELVHAGTQIFIEMNPESNQVKELSSIFDKVKEMMPEISKKLDETDVYWKTDLHEFAAEAMSNPELIKVLASIQYNKETVLEKVLRVISNMMGVKSETLYSAMTNVVADIVRQDVSEYEKLLGNASRATVEERAKAAQTLLDMSAEIQNKIIGKIKDCK